MINAIIFDLDGTLANTEKLHYRAWEKTLLANHVEEFTFTSFLRYVGTSNEKVAGDYIAGESIDKTVIQLIKEKQDNYMELIPEVELCYGATQIVEHFYGKKILAVASSSHEKEVRAVLKTHNLLDYFQEIICGDMVTNKKPDPEIYLKTSGLLQVPPSKCLAFEDSGPGLNAAKNAGMFGIAIPNEFTHDHDFARADRIIKNFSEANDNFLMSLYQ